MKQIARQKVFFCSDMYRDKLHAKESAVPLALPDEVAGDSHVIALQPENVGRTVGVGGKPRANNCDHGASGDASDPGRNPSNDFKASGNLIFS